jgi:hypothetical protein
LWQTVKIQAASQPFFLPPHKFEISQKGNEDLVKINPEKT